MGAERIEEEEGETLRRAEERRERGTGTALNMRTGEGGEREGREEEKEAEEKMQTGWTGRGRWEYLGKGGAEVATAIGAGTKQKQAKMKKRRTFHLFPMARKICWEGPAIALKVGRGRRHHTHRTCPHPRPLRHVTARTARESTVPRRCAKRCGPPCFDGRCSGGWGRDFVIRR